MLRREFQIIICASGAAVVLLTHRASFKAVADQQAADSRDAEEGEQTTRVVQEELPKWKMWTGADRKRELKLEPKSVLRWTNPGTQRVYGDVFV